MLRWVVGALALVLACASCSRPAGRSTGACTFSHKPGAPDSAERTDRYTLTCRIDEPVDRVWEALLDFERLVERASRPTDIEFSRFITTEERRSEVIDRLHNLPLPEEPDLETLKKVPLWPPLVYEEQNLTKVFASWSVIRFLPDESRAASGIYTLRFAKVDSLSSEEKVEGQFTLRKEGEGSHLTYVLVQSPHVKIAGEGTVGLVMWMMLGRMYVNGFERFMDERIQGIVREAQRRSGAKTGQGG